MPNEMTVKFILSLSIISAPKSKALVLSVVSGLLWLHITVNDADCGRHQFIKIAPGASPFVIGPILPIALIWP